MSQQIPAEQFYDLVVAGGGLAGVCAAIAAARAQDLPGTQAQPLNWWMN